MCLVPVASSLGCTPLPDKVTGGTLVCELWTSIGPPWAPSSWYESEALGAVFCATKPKLALRPGLTEGIWPPPVIFSAPDGGGADAQVPVVMTLGFAINW